MIGASQVHGGAISGHNRLYWFAVNLQAANARLTFLRVYFDGLADM